jgi:hypothetical protein
MYHMIQTRISATGSGTRGIDRHASDARSHSLTLSSESEIYEYGAISVP